MSVATLERPSFAPARRDLLDGRGRALRDAIALQRRLLAADDVDVQSVELGWELIDGLVVELNDALPREHEWPARPWGRRPR